MISVLLWILSILLVVGGVVGVLVPAIPGTILVLAGLVLAASIDSFQRVGFATLAILLLCTLLSYVIELAAAGLGAKRVKASGLAILGAGVGTIVGLLYGIPGLVIGPFVGAAAGEYIARKDLRRAGAVGFWTWIGILLGTAAKLALVFVMIGIFAFAYFV